MTINKGTWTKIRPGGVLLLVLIAASTGAVAQSNDNQEGFALVKTSVRWQLPNQNLDPIPVIQRLSFDPVRATRLSRSLEQRPDRKRVSDLQWKQLGALQPGSRVVIEGRDGGWTRGRFVSTDGENLTVGHDGTYLDLTRASIIRIQLRGGSNTGKGALAGFITGGVFGAVYVGYICVVDGDSGNCAPNTVAGSLFLGSLGAGLGAGLGSLSRVRTLIYQAHSPDLFKSPESPAQGVSPNPRTVPPSNQSGPGTPCLSRCRMEESGPSDTSPGEARNNDVE